jgi:hypothetical protein
MPWRPAETKPLNLWGYKTMDTAVNREKVLLTPEEIEIYRWEGLVIPNYQVPPAKLARLREGLDQLIKDNPNVRSEKLISAHISEDTNEGVRGNKIFFEFATDPELLDLVEGVIGPDLILWGAQVFCKPPGDGMEVPWHQDGEYWPIRPLATCTVWVAIDDVTPENGAMRYIPGSHKTGIQRHFTDPNDALVLHKVVEPGLIDESKAKDDVLSAGQVSLHDVYLIHGSPANRSNKRRAGLAMSYMPTTSHFDRSIGHADRSVADFVTRPIYLVRGVDRCGKNELRSGRLTL